jgi:type II secretory pathway pseudopilin PulG
MRERKKQGKSQKGQALIIILLAMSVVLTVVLSSVSKSITEITTTGYEEDALRAFSAAEAGVESALLDPMVGTILETYPDPSDTSVYYSGAVTEHNIASDDPGKQLTYPDRLSSGETATFYLCSQNADGQFINDATNPCWWGNRLRVCYGADDGSVEEAVEVSVYYDETEKSVGIPNNFKDLKVYRKVFDTPNPVRIPGATRLNADCGYDNGPGFQHRATIVTSDLPGCDNDGGCALLVKVRMLYADDQPVGLWTPSGAIPGQGLLISSTGAAGESRRKVEVYRGRPESLDLFDSAVFSLKGLSK